MGIGIFDLIITSLGLGVGLAMDAFAVSMTNGLNEPDMKPRKLYGIAGLFAFFQALMPLIGWICIRTIAQQFEAFEKCIPWIAFALLAFIGGKMLFEGMKDQGGSEEAEEAPKAGFGALIVQGIATSIDALSAGFTMSEYTLPEAVFSVLLIAAVTYVICYAGVQIGKKFGTIIAGKANIVGGIILIAIGFKIFLPVLIDFFS